VKTILLVEDEALIAMREADVLKKHGYRVLTVHNGDKAVAAAEREKIDLILMDIDLGLGKMDGTAAAERILRGREVPIVFCTSHAEKEMVEKVKNITSYGYVLKNSGEFVLLESVGMAFELFDAQKELRNSEAFLDSIIDQSPISSWISD
jgi:CheY-like chemotaxis protein